MILNEKFDLICLRWDILLYSLSGSFRVQPAQILHDPDSDNMDTINIAALKFPPILS